MVLPANRRLLGNHATFLPLYPFGFPVHFLHTILLTPQFQKASQPPFYYRIIHLKVCQRLREMHLIKLVTTIGRQVQTLEVHCHPVEQR